MNLSNLQPNRGSRRSRRRVGRGEGSGRGCTAGKGHKGQKARSGASIRASFEGGQMPLLRRVPKFGFVNLFRTRVASINVCDLDRFDEGAVVDPEAMKAKRLVRKNHDGIVKVLAKGEIKKALTVKAHRFSKSAVQAIEKAGGKTEILGK